MKIFTGNFANVKKYKANNLEPISIALSARYFNGQKYKSLNPDWSFKDFSKEKYTPLFNEILSKLNAKTVYMELLKLSNNKDVVLCCHEKAGDFCHRHLVAEWLKKELGIEVFELGKMQPEQTSLF